MKKIVKKINEKTIELIILGRNKAAEATGASHSMDVVGWAFIAVAVVLGVYTFLPGQVKTFVTNVFTQLNSGLGM